MHRIVTIVVGFALFAASAVSAQTSTAVQVSGVWARPAAVGETTAAYMTITNTGDTDLTLTAAETEAEVADAVEIHETSMTDEGVMQMRPLIDGLAIPAGESIELRPGSYHIMFLGVQQELVAGDAFALALTFETDDEPLTVTIGAPVLDMPPVPTDLVITQAWARPTAAAMDEGEMSDSEMEMSATEEAGMDMDMDMDAVSAAYMVIENTSDEDVTLVSGATDAAGVVEIHETRMNDENVMQMRPLADGLVIPAGERVELRPGGYHIMLMRLPDPLREGGALTLELTFDNGDTLTLGVPVEDRMMGGM